MLDIYKVSSAEINKIAGEKRYNMLPVKFIGKRRSIWYMMTHFKHYRLFKFIPIPWLIERKYYKFPRERKYFNLLLLGFRLSHGYYSITKVDKVDGEVIAIHILTEKRMISRRGRYFNIDFFDMVTHDHKKILNFLKYEN
jgi:hypothetical protein